jgi:hypothetical protein
LAGIVALGMALLLAIVLAAARHHAQEAKPLAKINDVNLFTDACPAPCIVLFRLHCSQIQEGDTEARFTFLQGSTQLLLGLGVEALLSRSNALLSQLHPDDQAILKPWLAGKVDVGQHLQLLFRVPMPFNPLYTRGMVFLLMSVNLLLRANKPSKPPKPNQLCWLISAMNSARH